jgi:hypothetical protein
VPGLPAPLPWRRPLDTLRQRRSGGWKSARFDFVDRRSEVTAQQLWVWNRRRVGIDADAVGVTVGPERDGKRRT